MSDVLREIVLPKLEAVKKSGAGFMARCPVPLHEDREASLSVGAGTSQPVVFKCQAGCDSDDVLAAIGLTWADLSNPRERRGPDDDWTPAGPAVAVYDYRDEDGKLLFQVLRTANKDFRQRRPDPTAKSGWTWKLGHTRRVLYRLPQVLQAVADCRIVYLAEGEKDVATLEAHGEVATCNPGGAGKWRPEYTETLRNAVVVIVADTDAPGRKHAETVRDALRDVAASVTIAEAGIGKDATDHFAAGYGIGDLTITWDSAGGPPARSAWRGDTADLLQRIHDFLGRFVVYPSEAAHVAHTLWVAHTHLMDAWESTPRIAFLSPEPGSGKTRALEVTELLAPNPIEAVNVTAAYLFRKVGEGSPTILFDEIDTVFGPRAKENEEIRGLLNAGHRRGAVAGRCVVRGKLVETEEIPAYCAVALAGLGGLPDTLLSRAVVVRMQRRAPGEKVEPYRRRVHSPEGHALRTELADWASSVRAKAAETLPDMPSSVTDRDADVWEPLLAVAELGEGDWPERARVAAVALVADSKAGTPSLGVRLLTDLRTVFGDRDAMSTEEILTALRALDEAPWADLRGKPLNARGLAQRLRQYGVHSKGVRIGETTPKGYAREDLHNPWLRYLVAEAVGVSPLGNATSATSATQTLWDDEPSGGDR